MGYFHLAQGKNQLYSILLDFYKEKIGENYDLFMEILKYDYVSLGKISSVPNIFAKVDIKRRRDLMQIYEKYTASTEDE